MTATHNAASDEGRATGPLAVRQRIEDLIERLWVHDELTADQLAAELDRTDDPRVLRELQSSAVTVLEAYEEVRA